MVSVVMVVMVMMVSGSKSRAGKHHQQ